MASPAPSRHVLARLIDHTLLAPTATAAAIERLCAEAAQHHFAAVCVNGVHVERCARLLARTDVAVCSVVGFPLGASAARVKLFEAESALEAGARELDMVLDIGALKGGDDGAVERDVAVVADAARSASALLKVILETGLLTEAEQERACRLACAAGAHFVKTSTGVGPRGASVADVILMRRAVGPGIGIKAAGGIRTAEFARALLAAGATRIGSSASVALVESA